MGFMQEIDEEHERQESLEKEREEKIVFLKKIFAEKELPFSEIDEDKIRNPDNYDDWGNYRHFPKL